MKLRFAVILLAMSPAALLADENQAAKTAYCRFITEQAAAQRDLLRTPKAVLGPVQPSTGTPPQLLLGAETSVSDQIKAGLMMDAAKTGCAVYNAAADAQQHIFYALPSLEKAVLRHRLELIQQTSEKLDSLFAENMKLVAAQNLSRPSVYALQSAKLRLDMNRTATLTGFASPYVPPLSDVPLHILVGEKLMAEVQNQIALNRLEKQNSWDIKVAGGARRQISANPSIHSPFGGYGEFSVTYNFGRSAINKHLDESASAYTSWKKNQLDDVVQQAANLEKQIRDTIEIQQEQLKSLLGHDAEVQGELDSLVGVETSLALTYRNELLADQLVLRVDIQDVQFRLDQLREYLRVNFNE